MQRAVAGHDVGDGFSQLPVRPTEIFLHLVEMFHGAWWHAARAQAGSPSARPRSPVCGPPRPASVRHGARRSSPASCRATRRTHHASASLRLRATPASISVSSTPAVAHAQPGHHRHAGGGEEHREPRRSPPPTKRCAGRPAAPRRRCASAALGSPRGSRRSRACSATRTSSSAAPSGSWGGARVPTTWISSASIVMLGAPSNQASGTLPLNQAPMSRSCSGPDGGGVVDRRRPR